MPWTNISSRQTSRQVSQDPSGRPSSRDSAIGGTSRIRSSISRGILDDFSFGNSPGGLTPRHDFDNMRSSGINASGVPVNSRVERELMEKESRDFYE